MGANSKPNLQKCGEILINVKTKNKRTKLFTFKCELCNTNCDQLKKFSLHLEEQHFQQLAYDSEEKIEIFEPEIKLEEPIESETVNALKDNVKYANTTEINPDPLETCGVVNTAATAGHLREVKVENDSNKNNSNKDSDNFTNEEMDYEDCLEDNDDDDYKPTNSRNKTYVKKKVSNYASDISSNDSNDGNIGLEKNKSKVRLKRKKSKQSESDVNLEDKEVIKMLLQAFEKQSQLWKLKERTNDKELSQKGFEIIANEVNEKLNTNLTWKIAKNHITALRIEYSYELEKQRKGNDHQIPWYYEHMKYLKENIDYMIRVRHRLDRRFKKMDQSLLPILIELYKKHDDLWQVNNIAFGITGKREEAFKKMVDDLKSNHNLEMTADMLQDYIKYINRLYSKDKELQLKCEMEKSEFVPSLKFYNDMSFLNESQGPFKCDICNTVIRKYENYHIHIAEHHNTRPFKCPLCEMYFKTFASYLLHAKRHLVLNSFPCNECGKVYAFKAELDRHIMGHTGEKPFLCQICGTSFRVRQDYDHHVRRHEKRFRFECHICKLGFNQLTKLKDHVKSHLNIRDIFCDICGKGFTANRYLNNHKLIHEDKKRYKCNVCGKEFAQGAGFRAHRKQHQPHLTAGEIKRKEEEEELQNVLMDE